MDRDTHWHRDLGLRLLLALGLALSGASWVTGCGDDADDDDDGGTPDGGGEVDAGDSGRGGRGGTGGRAGTGGRGGSSEDDAGAEDAGTSMFRDVAIDMMAVTPHMNQKMEFRVVSDDDELVALGVLDPLASANYEFTLPNSTPAGAHRMDFFADLNDNGEYDAPPTDHAWREDIAASGDDTIAFMHNTDFTDIATPTLTQAEDFTFMATDMNPHIGDLFELRVIEADSGRLVGRYLLGQITAASFTLTLPGIVASGTEYQVDFYADLNGNGEYNAPMTDHAWREMGTANGSGLTITFQHNTTFTDVQF